MSDLNYLKAKCDQFGNYFFDRESMDFFNSRIHDVLRIGPKTYRVITSEQMDSIDPRMFTVREFVIDEANGNVDRDNVSGFMEYATIYEARNHIKDGI